MPLTPFTVEAFTVRRLIELLSEKSLAFPAVVQQKLHCTYFKNYFGRIRPATLVVEDKYIDQDYLEDHAGFYDRCFHRYKRKCTRIHFFRTLFSEDDLRQLLRGCQGSISLKRLQRSYLGFVVIKPLPKGIVGRTCLVTYPSLARRRNYPIVRTYNVSLFGLNLPIDSLAFQEQDSVAAACATSALWSVLQGTGMLFGHATPSPVEITKGAAALTSEVVPRALPNKGLTSSQIIRAMVNVGLDPMCFSASIPWRLKATAYAYLKGKIPLLLTVALHDISKKKSKRKYNYYKNKHAVAITGFRLDDIAPIAVGKYGFKLRASKITKLYAHDDQVGPFARMVFDGKEIDVNEVDDPDNPKPLESMKTSWRGGDGIIGHTRALPEILFVPLYHKVRIDFDFVRKVALQFDSLLKQWLIVKGQPSLFHEVEWDIYLSHVNDLKEEIIDSPDLTQTAKERLALEALPKYVWRCILWKQNKRLLEMLIDATDIEGGKYFLRAFAYDPGFYLGVCIISADWARGYSVRRLPSWPILDWFRSQLVT